MCKQNNYWFLFSSEHNNPAGNLMMWFLRMTVIHGSHFENQSPKWCICLTENLDFILQSYFGFSSSLLCYSYKHHGFPTTCKWLPSYSKQFCLVIRLSKESAEVKGLTMAFFTVHACLAKLPVALMPQM